jgi:hypothetical protein
MSIVTIFVRHSANCPHRTDEKYKKCNCRKHLRWSSNGRQFTQGAKTRIWAEAEIKRQQLEIRYSGTATVALIRESGIGTTHAITAAVDSFILSTSTDRLPTG